MQPIFTCISMPMSVLNVTTTGVGSNCSVLSPASQNDRALMMFDRRCECTDLTGTLLHDNQCSAGRDSNT